MSGELHDFVFSPHATHFEQEGEELFISTTTPACDFCLDTRVAWEYPCEEFVIEEIGFGSKDNWLACEKCANLIERKLLSILTLRSVRSWIIRNGAIEFEQMDGIERIQQGFFDHCKGEPFRYEP